MKVSYESEAQEAQKAFTEIQPSLSTQITVNNQTDVDKAQTMITNLKQAKKALEEKRKSIVRPLDLAKRNIQSLFNPWKTKIDEAIGKFESAILGYRRVQAEIARKKEEAIREEQRKAEEVQRKKEEELKKTLPKEEAEEKIAELKKDDEVNELSQSLDLAGANAGRAEVKGMVTYYSCEVVKAIDVPRAYLIPDIQTLNAKARLEKETFIVPGCKLVKTPRIKG